MASDTRFVAELVTDKTAARQLVKQHLASDPRMLAIETAAPDKVDAWIDRLIYVFDITDGAQSVGAVMFEPKAIMHTQIDPSVHNAWFNWDIADTVFGTVFAEHDSIFTVVPPNERAMLSFATKLGFEPMREIQGKGTLLRLTPDTYVGYRS